MRVSVQVFDRLTVQLSLVAVLAMMGVLLAGLLLGLVEVAQNPAQTAALASLGDTLYTIRILPGWTR